MSVYSLDSLESENNQCFSCQDSCETCRGGSGSANETAVELPSERSPKNVIIARVGSPRRSWSQCQQNPLSSAGLLHHSVSSSSNSPSSSVLLSRSSSSSPSSSSFSYGFPSHEPRIPRAPGGAATREESGKRDKASPSVPGLRLLYRRNPRRPTSYLELYHRKLSAERSQRLRSLGDSRRSICGDNSDERHRELLEASAEAEEVSCIPTSADDQSELSFYRRVLEARRLKEEDLARNSCPRPVPVVAPRVFRPYTLKDYRSMRPVSADLDRSLGPDREILPLKRKCLVRRRSYGDAVSALNRQRIHSALQRHRARGSCECSRSCTPGVDAPPPPPEITEDTPKERTRGYAVKARSCNQSRDGERLRTPSITETRARSRQQTVSKKSKPAKLQAQGDHEEAGDHTHGQQMLDLFRARHFNEKQMINQLVRRLTLEAQ